MLFLNYKYRKRKKYERKQSVLKSNQLITKLQFDTLSKENNSIYKLMFKEHFIPNLP